MTESAPASGGRRWAFLLQPKWIAGHLLVLFVAVVFVLLGFWQLHRNDQKHEKDAVAKAKYAAPAPALGPPGSEPATGARAEATGRYDAAGEALLRNRVHNGVGGYDLLTPLVLGDGTAVVIDRGWVPRNVIDRSTDAVDRSTDAVDRSTDVLDPPAGTVTVRGPVGASRPLQPEDSVDERAGRTTLPARRPRPYAGRHRVSPARGVHQRAVPESRAGRRPARAADPAAVGRRESSAVRVPVVRLRARSRSSVGRSSCTACRAAASRRRSGVWRVLPARGDTRSRSGRRRRMQMPYAEGRTYYDADSHLMELGGWLAQYADPRRARADPPAHLGGAGALADEAVRAAEHRRGDHEAARARWKPT